ncbi:hypothetical protein N8621_03525, partial [Akkermansiaceae bacterium]|nr:hypothetical protein [Akkermansiaceae bacterium]
AVKSNVTVLPSWTIDTICEVPGGASPSYAHDYYQRDNAAYKEWDGISRSRENFLECEKNIPKPEVGPIGTLPPKRKN